MMTVDEVYRQALGEKTVPYAYQRKLAEAPWPEVLIAPTGLGKTAAVILGWVMRRLSDPDTPRRLVYCLPMRTLVEQTADAARCWFKNLAESGIDPQERLPRAHDENHDENGVHVLIGGERLSGWQLNADRAALIIGTQDMLLSRALMRGYAMSRFAWPLDFALLHNDAQWVFDEVQLMGAGRATSAQLEAFRRKLEVAKPSASLWVSATLDPKWLETVDFKPAANKVWRMPEDFEDAAAPAVRQLLDAPKPLSRAETQLKSTKKADMAAYSKELAQEVLKSHQQDSMTLIVVNTVARAQAVYDALLKEYALDKPDKPDKFALIHSRFRQPDRKRQMKKLPSPGESRDLIVVATQAIEAGVDLSAARMFTELAPWSAMVQRFGRANRYGELNEKGGAGIRWIDLCPDEDGKASDADVLARPYTSEALQDARGQLEALADARPAHLTDPGKIDPPRRVIRLKDINDLCDTDPDLSGFDVDVAPYVRDANDTDVSVFWRDLTVDEVSDQPSPRREELCAVPIGQAKEWANALKKRKDLDKSKQRLWRPDPQAKGGWCQLDGDPWPGLTLMADANAGGYDPNRGFDSSAKIRVCPNPSDTPGESNEVGGDPWSEIGHAVSLVDHTRHVVHEAKELVSALGLGTAEAETIVRAARWHDLGKAHKVFQDTMRRGLGENTPHEASAMLPAEKLLAKTESNKQRHQRRGFRHELASALAWLKSESWSRDADLIAYLIAAHHGKVRLSIRAWPTEKPPGDGRLFARGIWEDDELPAVDLGEGDHWRGGQLPLTPMKLGEDDKTGASWSERTQSLLEHHGPFRLAWYEALVIIADRRASKREQEPQETEE